MVYRVKYNVNTQTLMSLIYILVFNDNYSIVDCCEDVFRFWGCNIYTQGLG